MLTPKEQEVMDLRALGWPSKRIAERLGITRNAEKFRAWYARQKIAAGDPLTLPNMGRYCVFRFGAHVGTLPLHMLPKWVKAIWRAKDKLPLFADLNERPEPEILLGGVVQLTERQARGARRLLAARRRPGVYQIGPRGKVTRFAGEKACGQALGISLQAVRVFREHGHGRGCFWL